MINNQPSEHIKPTIETKVFKLEDGTEFVLQYPSNYNEIVDKKLAKLDGEYEETIKANISSSNDNNHKNEEEFKEEENKSEQKSKQEKDASAINQEKAEESDNSVNEEDENDNENKEEKENDAGNYQQIGEYNQLNEEDEEFIEVKEDDDGTDNMKEKIADNCKEQPVTTINKDEEKTISHDILNNIEFVEEPIKKEVKRKCSPVKNPEKIKEAMRSITIKAPKWAENLSDEEFMKRAKQFLSKK